MGSAEGGLLELPCGETLKFEQHGAIIFRGDVIHSGSGNYSVHPNTRFHVYIDTSKFPRNTETDSPSTYAFGKTSYDGPDGKTFTTFAEFSSAVRAAKGTAGGEEGMLGRIQADDVCGRTEEKEFAVEE